MRMKMVLTFKSGVQVRVDVDQVPGIRRNVVTGAVGDLSWSSADDWSERLVDFDMSQLACVHVERWHEPQAPESP